VLAGVLADLSGVPEDLLSGVMADVLADVLSALALAGILSSRLIQ
jgi:hypothetical protein